MSENKIVPDRPDGKGNRAVLARTPEFLTLAGTIRVPAAKRNVAWDVVVRRTRSDRAAARRVETIERIEPPPV